MSLKLWTEEAPPPEYVAHFDEVAVAGGVPPLPDNDDWVFILKAGELISSQLLANVRAVVHSREGRGYTGILVPTGKGSELRLLRSPEGKSSNWIVSCSTRRKRYYIYERNNS